jgi:hypothetical protein
MKFFGTPQHHYPTRVLILIVWLVTASGCRVYTDNGNDRFDNTPPYIGLIPDIQLRANSANNQIGIDVSDNRTRRSRLIINASSSNPSVITNQNIAVSGNNSSLFISPRANVIGSTIISITVTDGNYNTASTFFTVSVVSNRFNVSSFVPKTFSADANSEPDQLNTVELNQDVFDETEFNELIDET